MLNIYFSIESSHSCKAKLVDNINYPLPCFPRNTPPYTIVTLPLSVSMAYLTVTEVIGRLLM